jgi:hypothetical protein
MASIRDLLFYLISNYPKADHLSKARVTKMVYLADWKHSIEYDSQITDIEWYFNNHGPFVWDVVETAKENPTLFETESTENFYGEQKKLIKARSIDYDPDLQDTERTVADHVINATSDLNWNRFINLIYSTYPVVSTDQYNRLDLPRLASEYKRSPAFT